jgi:hypothetical protein
MMEVAYLNVVVVGVDKKKKKKEKEGWLRVKKHLQVKMKKMMHTLL